MMQQELYSTCSVAIRITWLWKNWRGTWTVRLLRYMSLLMLSYVLVLVKGRSIAINFKIIMTLHIVNNNILNFIIIISYIFLSRVQVPSWESRKDFELAFIEAGIRSRLMKSSMNQPILTYCNTSTILPSDCVGRISSQTMISNYSFQDCI